MDLLDSVFFAASDEGEVCVTNLRVRDWARLKLEENRPFIKAEIAAYIDQTYSDTVTATTASSNVITISDTSWLRRNVSIKFTGTPYGGLDTTTTYYVQNVVSETTFTVATTRYAANAVALTTVTTGTFGVELVYDETLCARDVDTYIDA